MPGCFGNKASNIQFTLKWNRPYYFAMTQKLFELPLHDQPLVFSVFQLPNHSFSLLKFDYVTTINVYSINNYFQQRFKINESKQTGKNGSVLRNVNGAQ